MPAFWKKTTTFGAGGGSRHVDGRAGGDVGSPGGGGTTTRGGVGGTLSDCLSPGAAGGQLQGGNSASGPIHAGDCAAGGGGGSGYFGGGGGSGGGGSGFPAASKVVGGITVTPDTADTNTNAGNGVVTISYTATAATGPIISGYRPTLCAADRGDSAANDTAITIATCDRTPGQTGPSPAQAPSRPTANAWTSTATRRQTKPPSSSGPATAAPTSNGSSPDASPAAGYASYASAPWRRPGAPAVRR